MVDLPRERIAEICRRYGVAKLSLYGSMLHGDARPDSDVDLLVEFLPQRRASLFDLGGMLMEIRDLAGREIDLRTPEDLSRYFRAQVLREAELLYAA